MRVGSQKRGVVRLRIMLQGISKRTYIEETVNLFNLSVTCGHSWRGTSGVDIEVRERSTAKKKTYIADEVDGKSKQVLISGEMQVIDQAFQFRISHYCQPSAHTRITYPLSPSSATSFFHPLSRACLLRDPRLFSTPQIKRNQRKIYRYSYPRNSTDTEVLTAAIVSNQFSSPALSH